MSMSTTHTLRKSTRAAVGLGTMMALCAPTVALADLATFTWNPSKALPALTGVPTAFTANSVVATNFNRTVNVNDLTALRQTVTSDQYQTVTGFTLGGSPSRFA